MNRIISKGSLMTTSLTRPARPTALRQRRPGLAASALLAATLAGCGGGGSGGPAPEPAVTSMTTQAIKYTQSLRVTILGTNLDQPLTVTTPACPTLTRNAAQSTPTSAIYECSNAALGANTVTARRPSDNTTLRTSDFDLGLPPQVTLTLSNGAGISGQVVLTLAADTSLTPETVSNFLFYVNGQHYDGLVFHRVVPTFVLQAGGYEPYTPGVFPTLKVNTQAPIDLEVNKGLSNKQWTIAMARTNAPNSATTQFFINTVDNPGLDPSASSAGYAVFGHVSAGIDVLQAIAGTTCFTVNPFGNSDCWPSPNVTITSAVQTRL
jgi:cyclophilin family peptidyl-prolyl cis-trans isomerase